MIRWWRLGLTSATLRTNSTFQPLFANNNPGELAGLLNGSLSGLVPGGTLVAAAKLPANFFVANPQFAAFPLGTAAVLFGGAYTVDNSGHSDYHSLQVQLNRRLSHGFSYQGSYVFSKVIGDSASGESAIYLQDYRTDRNGALDKQILSFNHAGVIKINGIYELPFGPGKPWLSSTNGFLSHVIGGWQTGAIFTYFTGAPLTITGSNGLNTSYDGIAAFYGNATQVGPLADRDFQGRQWRDLLPGRDAGGRPAGCRDGRQPSGRVHSEGYQYQRPDRRSSTPQPAPWASSPTDRLTVPRDGRSISTCRSALGSRSGSIWNSAPRPTT